MFNPFALIHALLFFIGKPHFTTWLQTIEALAPLTPGL